MMRIFLIFMKILDFGLANKCSFVGSNVGSNKCSFKTKGLSQIFADFAVVLVNYYL